LKENLMVDKKPATESFFETGHYGEIKVVKPWEKKEKKVEEPTPLESKKPEPEEIKKEEEPRDWVTKKWG